MTVVLKSQKAATYRFGHHCEECIDRAKPVSGLLQSALRRFALAFLTAKYAPRKLVSATTMATASIT
jgi:hypothetical protein